MGITSSLTQAAVKAAGKIIGSKAMIIIEGSETDPITVQFNPSEYTIKDSSQYTQRPRRKEDEPVVSYNGNNLSTLSVKLHFNDDSFTSAGSVVKSVTSLFSDSDGKDMTKTINRLSSLTRIDGDNHKPPGCIFVWGSLQFSGYAENVAVTYMMFDKSGKPLRAIVDLTLRGFNGGASEMLSPLLSPDRTKARTMTEDNSIWNIAEKEYGDVREWRRIAEANNIMNPLDIPVGTVLRVPSINDGK